MKHDETDDVTDDLVLDDDAAYQVLPEGVEDELVEFLKSFHPQEPRTTANGDSEG